MRVLLTGAFGNIGAHTRDALLTRGFEVIASDAATPRTRKLAAKLPANLAANPRLRVAWADLRDAAELNHLVATHKPDAIVHLAAVIPPPAYFNAALARAVNVDAVANLIAAASALATPPRIVFASSYTVHGPRNGARELPLLTPSTPVAPADAYAGHKVEAELLLRQSQLPHVVLRIGTCLPFSPGGGDPRTMRMVFELPRDSRSHGLDPRDAALAFANAVDADVVGRVLYIGGADEFRTRQRELMPRYQHTLGLAPFHDAAFAVPHPEVDAAWYFEDWMDTREAQARLGFQRHTLADYFTELARRNRIGALLLRPLGRVVRWQLSKQSRFHGRPGAHESQPMEDRLAAIFGDAARPQPASRAAAEALNLLLTA